MMRVIRAAGTAALATVLSAPLLFAQNITLVHGFASDPSTWASAVVYLTNRFPNHPVFTPGYEWTQSLEGGSQTLLVNNPSNAILIGHSLGGLVSRKYAESNTLYGIVTMGSPNNGTNMAGNYEHILAHWAYTGGAAYLVNQKLWTLQVPWPSNLLVDLVLIRK
jgi:pimeloyl-ACP methyl ester carboxylesterase